MFLFLACLTSIINASFAQEYYPKKAYTLGTDTFHFNQTYTAKLSKSTIPVMNTTSYPENYISNNFKFTSTLSHWPTHFRKSSIHVLNM